MAPLVTQRAERYEIAGFVISAGAPRFRMMDLEAYTTAAGLATPPIALEHLTPEPLVIAWLKP